MFFIFDLETSGLPKGRNAHYTDNLCFNSARIVSICWCILSDSLEVVETAYFLRKPDDFLIPDIVQRIHGISNNRVQRFGLSIEVILERLQTVMNKVDVIVSHNIEFDLNILLNEINRLGGTQGFIDEITKKRVFCTMRNGQRLMRLNKFPKLKDLYTFLVNDKNNSENQQLINWHHALDDTLCCKEILIAMIRKGVASFQNVRR